MPRADQERVTFQPMGRRADPQPGQSLLHLAQSAGVGIEAPCGGKGLCGKCRVRPEGAATPLTPAEKALLGSDAQEGLRLACQAALPQGGTVWVPPESRAQRQVILTSGPSGELELDPAVRAFELSVPPAQPPEPEAARERLQAALSQAAGNHLQAPPELPLGLLRALPGLLKQGGELQATLRHDREIVDLTPVGEGSPLGLAVDLGTTTVVAYLCDLNSGQLLAVSSEMNPQVPYGDDVISRMSLCAGDPQGLGRLSAAAVECVNALAMDACAQAGRDPGRILECVMVGNSAMHHIFLALEPASLAMAPYAPVVRGPVEVKARQAGLALSREAWLHWLPLKAGFVGADIVAVALAVGADQIEEPTLILDLGTNGEMVLAAGGRMLACSTAAGPALEGGHIGQGMRGAPGAVERASLELGAAKANLSVIGGEPAVGFCGSGLVSLISCLLNAGILLPGGGFDRERGKGLVRSGEHGLEFVAAPSGATGHGRDLVLTSKDVSEVQLAKAAIRAGAEVLMAEMGVERLERVLLAGAFGNYLDPGEAARIGLFPPVALERIQGVGNAAGVGAVMALLSDRQRRRAEKLARDMGYVELSGHNLFQELFVDSMPFPSDG
ncbi:ASKHA domain-containing protein [Desulfoferula mesophila]|uniref:Ferredoxin n=1 Tax=Desulfoferula mesophila TaxID=3058419 RepID=A0AAU9F3T8_9BACT|nr:ferredoxin [Desulfoferula mesophilus]